MKVLRIILATLRSFSRRGEVKQEIDEELRFHIEQRAAENIAAGMAPEDAAREAGKCFGNLQRVREQCRDIRAADFGEATLRDVRFGLRLLRKSPGFALIAVLTLALGIGATSSVFSLIHGVLLTPPPYPDPDRIVLVSPAKLDGERYPFPCTSAQWVEWKNATNAFEAIAGYAWGFQFLLLPDGSESVQGLFVTPEYFNVVGVKPLLGREFSPADMAAKGGDESSVILGYDLWQRRFAGDPQILGRVIHLSRRRPLTVVGVMPPGVRFLPAPSNRTEPDYDVNAPVDFWVPLWPPDLTRPNDGFCEIVGRLRPGVSSRQAQAELAAMAARQARTDPVYAGLTARARPLTADLNEEGRRLLLPLAGAVGLVFLISCANVSGLLAARGLQRQREYATRCALGAGRTRLFRQVLVESGVLALAGAALGGVLAQVIVFSFKSIGRLAIPRLDAVSLGWPVLACCVVAAVVAAVVAGLAPAFRASRFEPSVALKAGGVRSGTTRQERRFLGFVTTLQIALTVALLVGAGLLIRTTQNLSRLRPGYDTERILTMSITIPDMEKFVPFHSQVMERVSSLPGVKRVAMGWGLPLTGNQWTGQVEIEEGGEAAALKEKLPLPVRCVTPEYFDTLGMKMISGRRFQMSDAFHGGPLANTNATFVAIINQAMADRYFSGTSPLGRKLVVLPGVRLAATIVGVVQNARSEALAKEAIPEVYLCFWQFGFGLFVKHLVIQTDSDPAVLSATVQQTLKSIDPTVAIQHAKTLSQIRRESIAPQIFVMQLILAFSVVGIVLALVGIYGVLSLSVGSRRHEIAIRMAVGAQKGSVCGLVLREGFTLIGLGLVCGAGFSIVLAQTLQPFLFNVQPTDPATFAAVMVLFALVGLLACLIPARRAMRVDPMDALRYE